MDQKSIVLYLRMKGMSLEDIHSDLVTTLGTDAVAYTTVTKYARSASFVPKKDGPPNEPTNVEPDLVGHAILAALAEHPFSSVRELSRRTCLPRSTVHRHLTHSLGFRVRHLRWVPHFLTAEQKQMRVTMSRELLRVLSVQRARQWHDIVTLDESWIYLSNEHDLMWMAPGETVPDRERQTIQSPKLMLTVVWNPSGFHVVKALPKGAKFNSQYYTNNILVAISDWRQGAGGIWQRSLWIHADNARPHVAKVSTDYIGRNRMKQAPHPPYSPDLAPSDFFLFGYVKGKLMGYHADTLSELLVRIRVILSEISRETLNAVFLEWMERLQKCIDTNGEYVG